MKKALALILTFCMLLSCVAMSVSAAREFAVEENTPVDFAWTAGGEFWDVAAASSTDYFKTEIRIMGDSTKVVNPNVQIQIDGRAAKSPYINLTKDKVGIGAMFVTTDKWTVDYDFDYDKWYDIAYVVDGNDVTISVNGEEIGTVSGSGYTQPEINHIVYDPYISEYKITDLNTGAVLYNNSFSEVPAGLGGSIIAFDVEFGRHDLGEFYWNFPAGSNYNPVNVGNPGSTFVVEMDVRLDDAASHINSWVAKAAAVYPDKVGAGESYINYKFEIGEWYHIKWDVAGGKTAIYVDDVYVGTVNETPAVDGDGNAFWGWDKVSIDNFRVGDFFRDMEDGNLNNGQGNRVKYDFGVVEKDPLKDVPKYKAEGDAYLLEGTGSFTYLYTKKNGAKFENSIVSFDLAIVPNVEQNNNEDGVWFQFWRDGGGKRFNVGPTGAGRDKDIAAYGDVVEGKTWGDTTATNFHNVVIWFEYGKGTLYVDGVEMYSGMCGTAFDQAICMANMNCSTVIDNFNIYDLDMNCIMDMGDVIDGWVSDSGTDPVKVNVDAEDYCAANGHIFYEIVRTKTETCTENGVDTTYCAVCEAAYNETEIPVVPHQYNNFDKNRVVDGKYYADCKNCGGARVYSTVPAADSYTGKINAYFDMSDTFFAELNNSPTINNNGTFDNPDDDYIEDLWKNHGYFGDQFRYEDGKAVLDADSYLANYSEFNFKDLISGGIDVNDWSYSYRMTYNGLFDTDDILNSGYPHTFYFWLRGTTLEIGYDADKQELYIGPSELPGAASISKITTHYEFKEGLTYTFKFGLRFVEEDEVLDLYEYADITMWINDEPVLVHSWDTTSADIYIDCEFTGTQGDQIYPRNFGFAYTMDDLVIGSYDFAWNKVAGDVDNDGVLSVADAMVMRKYLAKVIDDEAVFVDLMDVNEDAVVNAKDQLTIRKALAA